MGTGKVSMESNENLSTESKSITQEIREQLSNGKSAQEIIAIGYAPGTVFKIQWQMRKAGKLPRKAAFHTQESRPDPTAPSMNYDDLLEELENLEAENKALHYLLEDVEALDSENEALLEEVERLRSNEAQAEGIQAQLSQALAHNTRLESRVEALESELRSFKQAGDSTRRELEVARESLRESQRRVQELTTRLQSVEAENRDLKAYLSRTSDHWQRHFRQFRLHG